MILKKPERESSKMHKHPVKFSLEKQNSQMSLAETGQVNSSFFTFGTTPLNTARHGWHLNRLLQGWIRHLSQHNIVPQIFVSNFGAIGPPSDSDIPLKASLLFMLS